MSEVWRTQPGAVELIDGLRKIDSKLAEATETAFRGGYTVDQVRTVLKAGNLIATPLPKAPDHGDTNG